MSNNPIRDFFSIFDEGRKIANIISDIRDSQRKQLEAIEESEKRKSDINDIKKNVQAIAKNNNGQSMGVGNGKNGNFNANDTLKNIETDVRAIAKKLKAKGISTATSSSGGTPDSEQASGATADMVKTQKKEWGKFFDGLKALFDSIKTVVMDILDAWGKVDQAAFDFQKAMGGSAAAAKSMRRNAIDTVVNRHIGDRFSTSSDELIKLEQGYNKEIGRRAAMSNDEREDFAAMNALMGSEKATQFAKAYEMFGKNIEGAGSAASRLYKDASKNGVAFEKYSENVLSNLKMAQTYNFANGTRGLEEMAMKATALKLEMQQITQMADKVSTVEGATTAAANLSVLGGSFANFSNPMSMLYEGLNDVGALTDRVTEMFGNLAYFDRNSGEIDMSAFNKQRVRAAAQATGMNPSALMDMIYTKARINQLEPEISGLKVNDEVKNLLKNTAQIDKDGNGYVTINGQKKGLNQITNNDLESLKKLSQTEGENIKDIAEILRGWNDSVSGMEKQYEANKQQIAETSGLGETAKGIVQAIGTSNFLLKGIWGTLAALTVIGGATAFGRGIMAVRGSRVGAGGNGVTAAAGKGGGSAIGNFFGKGARNSFAQGARAANIANNGGASKWQKLGGGLKGSFGKWGTGGAIGGIGSALVTGLSEFGGDNDHMAGEKWARTAGSGIGGFIGGALGSFLGPLGTLAGAALGSAIGDWAGGLAGMSDSEKTEFKRKYNLNLLGDYTGKELQTIRRHRDEGEPLPLDLRGKMENAGDTQYCAAGGIIDGGSISTGIAKGPSHLDGGIQGVSKATGKNVEFEGGEMVLSREDTKMFLQAVSSWKDYAKSTPREGEYNPVKVSNEVKNTTEVGGTIKIEPMDIKINGTIKLEGITGQSTNLNFDELLRNRQFVDKLADLMYTYIEKHLSMGKNGEKNYRRYGVV